MAHGDGGGGAVFPVAVEFATARHAVGNELEFRTTTGQLARAIPSHANTEPSIPTISFPGHGNVCESCWGFRQNCNGTRIGHCVEALAGC